MKITEPSVEIKGRQSYLEISLYETDDFAQLKAAMIEKLESAGRFFMGAKQAMVIGDLTEEQKAGIKQILKEEFSFIVVEFREERMVVQPIEKKKSTSKTLPEATIEGISLADETNLALQTMGDEAKTIFIQNTVRNGQRIDYVGNIIVYGDVNRGGELVATKNIIVMGSLKGRVHAGSMGDESAMVMALELAPQQLRIATGLAIPPDNDEALAMPEIASIQNGELIIEPLMREKKKKKKFWNIARN